MKLKIARPREGSIPKDKMEELRLYLVERWRRAWQGRFDQVDAQYAEWDKAYNGIALEQTRTVPFYKSSNFVVKLIRMYLDTFVARSLNIIYATRPLYVVDGLPRELKEAWELYLNNKTLYQWDYYKLTRDVCFRGNKNGTVAIKTPWLETTDKFVSIGPDDQVTEQEFICYSGPNSECIPFEDFYVYPIVVNNLCDAEVIFHKVRFTEEEAKRLIDRGAWTLPPEVTVDQLAKPPRDAKKTSQQGSAGIIDPYYKEVTCIECHLKRWSFSDDSNDTRSIVVLFHPELQQILDLYYNPYPRNLSIFTDYRPLPREELYYGESMCQLLGQSQEEASVIHNDRRNNSFISNAVCFKRKSGSLIPNPSTNWYPGKVFDLDDIDDLEVFQVGRNYDDMLQQEDYVFGLAGKLSGIDDVMQGAVSGIMGKRGIYNTMGTIALMQEGNQRQDTNLKDVRETMSCIGSIASQLQAYLGGDDPFIETLPSEVQGQVRQVLKLIQGAAGRYMRLEIKTSSAGANKEVERQNLLQIAGILSQYGQTVQQMSMQLANPQINPSLRLIMNEVVKMQKWMATRLLRQFDEFDAEEVLPDVSAAIEATLPGGSRTTKEATQGAGPNGMVNGGAGGALPPVSRSQVAALSQVPTLPGGAPQQ